MDATTKTISAIKARQNLGTIMNEVAIRGDTYVIERAGKPVAALVPLEEYEQTKRNRDTFFAMIDLVRARTKSVSPKVVDAVLQEAAAQRP
jgi:prevent-host-death family protein